VRTHLLIDAIVRQTTVLIAQLATAGGFRAPLAHIADQVFRDLARSLQEQGISRRVSADMFGMALRAYVRKVQRLGESTTFRGHSLWESVLSYVTEHGMVTRRELLERFHRDEETLVRGVVRDLVESGLVFSSGLGDSAVFRPSTQDELADARMRLGGGVDELLWAVIYREGPLGHDVLQARSGLAQEQLDPALTRLIAAARVRKDEAGRYSAAELVVPLDSEAGWEAAVFDHYHALVSTLCCRLSPDPLLAQLPSESIGGSTYTFDVWPGHPLYEEVLATLRRARRAQSELRKRVEAHNALHGVPDSFSQVVTYAGQSVVRQGDAGDERSELEHDIL
jgi:hypothetical protein